MTGDLHDRSSRDRRIALRAAQQLTRDADALDDTTRVRLRAARLRALDALDDRPAITAPTITGFGVPAVAAIAAAAIVTMLIVPRWSADPPPDPIASLGLEDLDILAASEDLELYEHLEFYRWLETNEPI